jgi:hypothetical protein
MSNGTLLINASYIRTGILDATVLRTGIISDYSGKTKWDLSQSKISTTNIVVTGGSISFGGVKLNSGGFTAGNGNVIKTGSSVTASGHNMVIGSGTAIELVAPHLRVIAKPFKANGYYSGTIRSGITKDIRIQDIQWIKNSGSTIKWQGQHIDFEITNGIITNVRVVNSSVKDYSSNDEWEEEMGVE